MKKLLITLISFFVSINSVLAHPLDISSSYLSFNKNYLNITTYFHSYEIEYLLAKKGIQTKSVNEYYEHEKEIKFYIKESIKLKIDKKYCEIENIELLKSEEYEILTKGIEINYHFKCEENIESGQLEVYFFDNFKLQTNKITIYNLNNNSISSTPIGTTILNSKFKIYDFDLSKNFKKCRVDSDGDGFSDTEELVYKTDTSKIDTDNDFYTDYEEVYNSWNPLDSDLGPKQVSRDEIPFYIIENIKKNKKTLLECQNEDEIGISKDNSNGLLNNSFGNSYFMKTLESIKKYIKNESEINLTSLFLIIIGLGFIHAMGPGHSKSLLISYILDKNKSFFDGFVYVLIFTITHLLDIIILFILTKIIFNFYDISNYIFYIQIFSISILLIFSIYLLIKSIKNIKSNDMAPSNKKNIKSSILLGFVSGLAPCTFGWSIFLLLFSMGSLNLIFPMIISLGIGIFLCLFVVLIITLFLRKKVFEKIYFFSRYSSFLSSFVLLFLSIFLMQKLL